MFVLAQLLNAFCKCHATVLQEIVRCVPLISQTRNRTDLHDFALNRSTQCFVQLFENGGMAFAKSIQQLWKEDLASNVSSHGASIDKEHIVFVLNSQFVSTSETKKE